jgi:hypothetical protein
MKGLRKEHGEKTFLNILHNKKIEMIVLLCVEVLSLCSIYIMASSAILKAQHTADYAARCADEKNEAENALAGANIYYLRCKTETLKDDANFQKAKTCAATTLAEAFDGDMEVVIPSIKDGYKNITIGNYNDANIIFQRNRKVAIILKDILKMSVAYEADALKDVVKATKKAADATAAAAAADAAAIAAVAKLDAKDFAAFAAFAAAKLPAKRPAETTTDAEPKLNKVCKAFIESKTEAGIEHFETKRDEATAAVIASDTVTAVAK